MTTTEEMDGSDENRNNLVDESYTFMDEKPESQNPNLIPEEDLELMESLGLSVGPRMKRGRYGAVFEGVVKENFSFDRLRAQNFHYLHCKFIYHLKPEVKFAMKYVDIEKRLDYSISDIAERLEQEIKFIEFIDEDEKEEMVVHTYFMVAISPSRYYIVMELANTNLQCLIRDYQLEQRRPDPMFVIHLYECLVRIVLWFHRERIIYGMLRTSNILVFHNPNPLDAQLCPFKIKITDFVQTIFIDHTSSGSIEEAIKQDLEDLYRIHMEIFTLTRFKKLQAFQESLRTILNGQHCSVPVLNEVLELVGKFRRQQFQF